jgi:hypothetical protein
LPGVTFWRSPFGEYNNISGIIYGCIGEDEKVDALLQGLQALNNEVEKRDLKTFVWNIEKTI